MSRKKARQDAVAPAGAVVVITGANRGIGLEVARQLHARGCVVYGACRKASDELRSLGLLGGIREGVDVVDEASLAKLAESLAGVEIEVLINNAGICVPDSFESLDLANIRQQFEVNSLGPLSVTRALHPLIKKPGGYIGIVTSLMGSISDNGSGGLYGYRASKSAVNMIGRSLAMDLSGEGICVQLMHPGQIETEMITSQGWSGRSVEDGAKGLIEVLDAMKLAETGTYWHGNYGEGIRQLEW